MATNGDKWHVLRFSWDEICTAWQDARLACVCDRAWVDAGRPEGFQILQAPGDGECFLEWFVSPRAGEILDANLVPWRQFLFGECARPPEAAKSALRQERGDTKEDNEGGHAAS